MTDLDIIAQKLEQLTYRDLMSLAEHLADSSNQWRDDGELADDRYFADTLLFWAKQQLEDAE